MTKTNCLCWDGSAATERCAAEVDYSLQVGQKPQDSIQLAILGKISGQILSDSNRPYGSDGGESIEDHCFSVLAAKKY